MIAMFNGVKDFAVFNSKPHLFDYGQPYQMGDAGSDLPVYIKLMSGSETCFEDRVRQFGGVVI